jgi:type I restriction enzyme S subunit
VRRALHLPSTAPALPRDWHWSTLDDLCEGIFDCPHSTPHLTPEGPLVVRSQDIRSGELRVHDAGHVSEETYLDRTRRAEPRYGDLLYSREGTYFGIAAEVPKDTRVCLGQRMVLIRPAPNSIHFRFLRYWLNSPTLAYHVHGYRDGTVAERLNLPTIRSLPVPVPSYGEQSAIADILGTLDDKIELNRKMNETLEAIARALFKSWFVDFDPVRAKAEGRQPVGMDAETTALFPKGFGETDEDLPESWRRGPLNEIAQVTMGQSPPGETYNESGNGIPFYQGVRGFGLRFPSRRVYCTAPTRYAQKGDVLLSVRAPVGEINVAIERCAIGRGLAAVRQGATSNGYVYYLLRSQEVQWETFEGEGTVFGSASKADLENLRVLIPTPQVLGTFTRTVEPLDARIEANERESQNLAAIRDALLPKLVSGEIRVGNTRRAIVVE